MKEGKYFVGMFVGGIISAFHLVFKSDVSEHFAMVGIGIAFCSAVYYFVYLFTNKD